MHNFHRIVYRVLRSSYLRISQRATSLQWFLWRTIKVTSTDSWNKPSFITPPSRIIDNKPTFTEASYIELDSFALVTFVAGHVFSSVISLLLTRSSIGNFRRKLYEEGRSGIIFVNLLMKVIDLASWSNIYYLQRLYDNLLINNVDRNSKI